MKICIRSGDKDQAFVWLAKAVQERNRLAWELKINPLFDPLRSDPRFEALVEKCRQPNGMTNGNASAEQRKLAAIMFTDMMGYSAPRAERREAGARVIGGTSRAPRFNVAYYARIR